MRSNRSAVRCEVHETRNGCTWAARLGVLLLCAGLGILSACGAAQTQEPTRAVYIDAPDDGAVLGEYLISVRKAALPGGKQDPVMDVRRHIEWLYERAKVPLPIQGCGVAANPLLDESKEEAYFCVRLPAGRADVDQLLGNDAILVIERNLRFAPSGVQVCTSWGLDLIDQSLPQSRNNVFAYSHSGKNVRVYVVDTGVADKVEDNSYNLLGDRPAGGNWAHLEVLKDKMGITTVTRDPRTRQDCSGHGTYLAETLGGKITGVAKSARLQSVRVSHCMHDCKSMTGTDVPLDKGDTDESVILAALKEIRDNEDAINKYYAARRAVDPAASNPDRVIVLLAYTPVKPAADFGMLKSVVRELVDNNVVLVAAAGNADMDAKGYVLTDIAQNIRAGALDHNKQLHRNSNYGPSIDILAPAEGGAPRVFAASHPCGAKIEGSSVAAAFVAGAVAQLLEADPGLAAEQVRGHLQHNDNIIRDRPMMTPYFVLRTEQATGMSGIPAADEDGVKDALSYVVCPAGMSCKDIDFCPGRTTNRCSSGLNTEKDDECGRGVRCESGSCESCGGLGDRCCGGTDQCGFGLSCSQDRCRCGDKDQACCGGTTCNSSGPTGGGNLICDAKDKKKPTCQACGKKDGPCCGDGSCEKGGETLVCNSDTNKCEQCGMKDSQRCCADGSCPGSGLRCVAGTCTACGKDGAACCTGPGPKCEVSLECQSGTCGRCGGVRQACCTDPGRSPCDGDMGCAKSGSEPAPLCHGTCMVRCLHGEWSDRGEQRTGLDCYKAGLAFCASPMCGPHNQLVRARYNGRIYWQDYDLCGRLGNACCQGEDDAGGTCPHARGAKCTTVSPTGTCSTDVRICK